jgi:hypothetical protein
MSKTAKSKRFFFEKKNQKTFPSYAWVTNFVTR